MRLPPSEPATLEVEAVTVRFGGVVALDDVTLAASPAMITGLIGPNGAGKTTLFNVCTGVVPPVHGTVRLDGRSLDRMRASRRASLGLGRTFQLIQLLDAETVLDNVMLGPEGRLAGQRWWSQALATRQERVACREAAEDAVERCGIGHLANVVAGDLTAGQRRLVEVARAIASRFRFLLLDEPASGLDEAETASLGGVLEDLYRNDGTGVLLVEHDVDLVREMCSRVYVLDFGRLIAEGPTDEVMESETVQAAYLGSEVEEAV